MVLFQVYSASHQRLQLARPDYEPVRDALGEHRWRHLVTCQTQLVNALQQYLTLNSALTNCSSQHERHHIGASIDALTDHILTVQAEQHEIMERLHETTALFATVNCAPQLSAPFRPPRAIDDCDLAQLSPVAPLQIRLVPATATANIAAAAVCLSDKQQQQQQHEDIKMTEVAPLVVDTASSEHSVLQSAGSGSTAAVGSTVVGHTTAAAAAAVGGVWSATLTQSRRTASLEQPPPAVVSTAEHRHHQSASAWSSDESSWDRQRPGVAGAKRSRGRPRKLADSAPDRAGSWSAPGPSSSASVTAEAWPGGAKLTLQRRRHRTRLAAAAELSLRRRRVACLFSPSTSTSLHSVMALSANSSTAAAAAAGCSDWMSTAGSCSPPSADGGEAAGGSDLLSMGRCRAKQKHMAALGLLPVYTHTDSHQLHTANNSNNNNTGVSNSNNSGSSSSSGGGGVPQRRRHRPTAGVCAVDTGRSRSAESTVTEGGGRGAGRERATVDDQFHYPNWRKRRHITITPPPPEADEQSAQEVTVVGQSTHSFSTSSKLSPTLTDQHRETAETESSPRPPPAAAAAAEAAVVANVSMSDDAKDLAGDNYATNVDESDAMDGSSASLSVAKRADSAIPVSDTECSASEPGSEWHCVITADNVLDILPSPASICQHTDHLTDRSVPAHTCNSTNAPAPVDKSDAVQTSGGVASSATSVSLTVVKTEPVIDSGSSGVDT